MCRQGRSDSADPRSLLYMLSSSMKHLSTRLLASAGFDAAGEPQPQPAPAPPEDRGARAVAEMLSLQHEGPEGLGALGAGPGSRDGACASGIRAHHGVQAADALLQAQAPMGPFNQALSARG